MWDWRGWIVAALWLAWTIYWTVSALGNKNVKKRESRSSRLLHAVPMALAALLMVKPHWGFLGLNSRFMPYSEGLYGLGLALVIAGLGLTVWARIVLGGNWSATVTLKDGHELIRSGPYRAVRHPIYSGLLLATLGTTFAFDEWRGWVALALMIVAVLPKVKLEEDWMIGEFGAAYGRYKAEVKALVPGVW